MVDTIPKLHKNTISTTIVSWLVAVAFLFNSICLLANILLPSFVGFGDILIIVILGVGVLSCLISSMKITLNVFFINVFLLFVVLFSYIYYGFSSLVSTLLVNFFVWGIGITVIMMQDYDLKKTVNIAFLLSTITIVFELITNAHESHEPMVWTYAVFPCLASIVVHFVYCRYAGFWLKLLYIPGAIMLFKFFLNANRGGMVSLLLLIYLVSIKRINSKTKELKNKRLLNILLLILLLCSVLFYEQIIALFYNMLTGLNYEVSAVTKMYRMIQLDNVTNNRTALYGYAWNGFLQSPIWGNGVGGFSVNHGGWAHNFILQILYEGGVILFFLIMIPLVRIFLFFVNGKQVSNDEYSLFILFFCTSIPKLLFSTELWNTQGFWMLLAFGMITMNKYVRVGKESK